MMSERRGVQLSMYTPSLEEIVESDEFLRKLDAAVDFSFIYDELRPYYCAVNGKYSTDPVVIVKSLLIAFLYGIISERRLEQELKYNALYRWFIGVGFDERVPDHSTISQLRRRKFNDADLFNKLFVHVLKLCVEAGLVSGRLLITDSTHMKANAAKVSKVTVEIERETAEFFERLDTYEALERERSGMPEITRKPPKHGKTEQTRSITDPDAGWLKRPDKPEGFHYLSHQTFDAENGIIVDVDVTAGNIPDNKPYTAQIDRTINTLEALNIETIAVCADAAYDTALIHKGLEDYGLTVYFPKKDTSDHSKTEYKRDDFTYNQAADEFVCPGGKTLKSRRLQRLETGVFHEYRSVPKDCRDCTNREKCLAPSQKSRKIQVNIFQSIVDRHHASDGSAQYNSALRKRQIWCEGTFAAQKARHNLRNLFRRGLEAAKEHCLLSATAINLKRMVKCLG
ncbi:transposase [Clostridia bacterium]|nr:transposase [Clostridia bacterium]